jgi:hypothetical protein
MPASTLLLNKFRDLKALDQRRPSAPGEHWATMAGGMWAMRAARRQRSTAARLALWAVGGLLLARGLSGRDGPIQQLKSRRTLRYR